MSSTEDNAGLGNHIRHDAITGDAEKSARPLQRSRDDVTVFVTASTADEDPVTGQSNVIENAVANNTSQSQQQQDLPYFPAPPLHPSLMPDVDASLKHDQLTLSVAPIVPNVAHPFFPSPPPSTMPYHPSHFPLPQNNSRIQLNIPQPSGLPPEFPTLANARVNPTRPPTIAAGRINAVQTPSQQEPAQSALSHPHSAHNTQYLSNILQHEPNIRSGPCTQQTIVKEEKYQPESEQSEDDLVEKARAIARRFHEESSQRLASCNKTIVSDDSFPTGDYREKRQTHFQKEKAKLSKFRLKNLEYVMRNEEIELRRHVDCMDQITAFEEHQSIQLELANQQQREKQAKLEQQRRKKAQTSMMHSTGGGIGTRHQQRAERVRKREHLEHGRKVHSAPSRTSQRNSLYLTNLPTDGTTTEGTLHSLFSSYGRLNRVTMYRDRSTGELKGDGLIVFGTDALDWHNKDGDSDLIGTVCLQVSKS